MGAGARAGPSARGRCGVGYDSVLPGGVVRLGRDAVWRLERRARKSGRGRAGLNEIVDVCWVLLRRLTHSTIYFLPHHGGRGP